jgi:radical SAM/Cys-rich protein
VFGQSIRALQTLNASGYGTHSKLALHLVYNPVGAFLPGAQAELESVYKAELRTRFGIVFNSLYTITNMPIERFGAHLRRGGEWQDYMELLVNNFNPGAVAGLMCRDTINVGWRGEVYDCDFNGMLGMQWRNGKPLHLWDVDPHAVEGRAILTGEHCFGCTAGAGSSCGGATVQS